MHSLCRLTGQWPFVVVLSAIVWPGLAGPVRSAPVATGEARQAASDRPAYKQVSDLTEAERKRYEEAKKLNARMVKLYRAGRYREALIPARRASEILKKVLGKEHPDYAGSLHNLAALYKSMGDYAKAEPLYKQTLRILNKTVGEEHPRYAMSLNNLALLYSSMGDYAKAEPLYKQALEIEKKALGEEHPDYATSLHNLAALYESMGEYAKAEPLLRRVLGIAEQHREATFAVQSERQRLQFARHLRSTLDSWLSVAPHAGVSADELHAAVLRWKGAVFARQIKDRLAQRRPELKSLLDELNTVRTRWATLALRVPEPKQREAWRRQVNELRNRKENLESQLARKSSAYRQAGTLDDLRPKSLAQQLAAGTVFVDFLVYTHFSPPINGKDNLQRQRRLLAFVLRRDAEPQRLDLGPVAPIAAAVDAWRKTFGRDEAGPRAGKVLANRIAAPLRPFLARARARSAAESVAGAPTLLVAPDGPLCRFPLAVLPGGKPGTYLIEDLAVGYVTSGRQAAELLAKDTRSGSGDGTLLAAGIAYDAKSQPSEDIPRLDSSSRRAVGLDPQTRSGFGHLPGTKVEARAIQRLYSRKFPRRRKLLLSDKEPSEPRIKRELPGGWRYVHLATHGFFAPPEKVSAWRAGAAVAGAPALTGGLSVKQRAYDPLLLSGLVLAGAGREGDASVGEPPRAGDDGILTAAEVAGLDLSATELVVLSACETGLGEVAGGEGVLGLQRAFHAAGTRGMVTSLWRVDDVATALLMEEFYGNLWEKNLAPLQALRQAQLTLLNHPERIKQRQKQLVKALAARGLKFEPVKLPEDGPSRRSHPGLWAGFLFSGQWR